MFRQSNQHSQPVAKRYLVLFFILTIPLAWIFWIPMILINQGRWILPVQIPTLVWSSLGAVSPLLSLLIIGRVSRGQVQLNTILKNIRFSEWRSRKILVSALFLITVNLILSLLYFFVAKIRGTESGPVQLFNPDVFSDLGWFILLIIPIQYFAGLVTSPLFEEPGWRGFAYENLRFYLPRDIASLIVGSYWWLWHQGMNMAFNMQPSLQGYISMVLDSWAIDTLYTINKSNLLAAMLAHQSLSTVFTFLYPLPELWYLLAVKFIAVIALRSIRQPTKLSIVT